MPTARCLDTAIAMPEDGAAAREFRPNSHAFLAVPGAAAILAIASGLAALSGSSPAQLWIGLVLASLTAVLALRSLRLIVTPDSVMLRLFGFARTFPADQIDPVRCNELAFMDLFQISLHDGRFMLIPRKAFSDAAPFAAIDAVIAKSTPIRSRGDEP
jgi:hypothetical protein